MKLFMFAASLREESVNKKLIQLAARLVQTAGHTVDMAEFSEFDLPLYNADIQNKQGFPKNVAHFIERMHNANGTIIAVPEYNFSVSGAFKNLVDWVSRVTPMPWRDQRIQLLSASPALAGGNRGLWHARVPLEACGALVAPDMFSLASAYEAFDEQGGLKNPQLQQMLANMLNGFLQIAGKLA